VTPGNAALNWEETHAAGCWYSWGGTSCGRGYDCSGVVYEAFLHEGINLGRTTYDMLRSRHLVQIPVADAQRGDLLFYGSGHVELKTAWWHTSYGAHESGTRVGYAHWNSYWAPTMAFRVR
jgi:cell wall-associated NlpC family hydrolase